MAMAREADDASGPEEQLRRRCVLAATVNTHISQVLVYYNIKEMRIF